MSLEETGGQRSLLSSRKRWTEGGREWVGRSLADHVSDAEVLRSTLAMRHWLRQTARLDSISFCGAVDVGRRCGAGGGSIFTPDFLSPSACAHCVRPQSVPLLSFPAVAVLYSSCVLYQICAERDGASLLCPLEPSRRPHPCRLPSLVHYRRGCAAAFRPRGLRTILRLAAAAVAAKGEGEGCEKQRCTYVYVRQTDQGSFRRVDAQSRQLYCTRLEV